METHPDLIDLLTDISYICFGFLAIMWKVVPPHIWAACCVFTWGLVSTVQAGVHSWGAMMALRFIMGAAEVAYGPGIPYLLSFFYLRHELRLEGWLVSVRCTAGKHLCWSAGLRNYKREA